MSKYRILLVADDPRWIFHRHCLEISKRLDKYDFEIIYRGRANKANMDYLNSFDVIYILDFRLGISNNLREKTVIGIRSEFEYKHSDEGILNCYKRKIEGRASAFHVVNKRQFGEFNKVAKIHLVFAPHGVDVELFRGIPSDRKKPVVGIVGRRNSGGKKGFNIIEQACNKLGIEIKYAEQNMKNGNLSKEQMVDFYRSIDIYCNMSESEGLSNTILESGSMSKIVIATPVGAVPEMIEDNVNGLVCRRNVDDLVNKLDYCKNNFDEVKKYGLNFRKVIEDGWSWDKCVNGYDELFNKVLK